VDGVEVGVEFSEIGFCGGGMEPEGADVPVVELGEGDVDVVGAAD
jgi:hypothetical protein